MKCVTYLYPQKTGMYVKACDRETHARYSVCTAHSVVLHPLSSGYVALLLEQLILLPDVQLLQRSLMLLHLVNIAILSYNIVSNR
jgi:hypothetical protein